MDSPSIRRPYTIPHSLFQWMLCRHQVAAIKSACKNLNPQYNPPLTFIVIQKRHNTRCVSELNCLAIALPRRTYRSTSHLFITLDFLWPKPSICRA